MFTNDDRFLRHIGDNDDDHIDERDLQGLHLVTKWTPDKNNPSINVAYDKVNGNLLT